MREIKFRGLRTDGKGWVYGSFIHNSIDCPCIIDYDAEQYEVIPESVGQFTGIKHNNGKEIYEGDVVNHGKKSSFNPNPTYKVMFGYGAFYLLNIENNSEIEFNDLGDYEIEITGNIHEQK